MAHITTKVRSCQGLLNAGVISFSVNKIHEENRTWPAGSLGDAAEEPGDSGEAHAHEDRAGDPEAKRGIPRRRRQELAR